MSEKFKQKPTAFYAVNPALKILSEHAKRFKPSSAEMALSRIFQNGKSEGLAEVEIVYPFENIRPSVRHELNKVISEYKGTKSPKIKTLDSELSATEFEILADKGAKLFKGTKKQWTDLFSSPIRISEPIKVIPPCTLQDVAYFLMNLKNNDGIGITRYKKILEDSNAFSFEGNIITAQQLSTAEKGLKKSNPKHLNEIESLLELLF